MREKRYLYLHFALIASLVLVTFVRSLGNSFVWDDLPVLVENPVFEGAHPLSAVLTAEDSIRGPGRSTGYYRPLTYLSFYADRLVWGGDPAGYHLTSLFLHVGVSLALYALLSSFLTATVYPFFVTLLFALNPLTVEAVCFVSGGRNTMLCTLFVLLALILHRRGSIVLAVFSVVAAAAAKESGFLLPLVLLAYDALVERKLRNWRTYALYLVSLLLLLLVRIAVVSHEAMLPVLATGTLLLSPELILRYLAIIVVPLLHKVAYAATVPSPLSLRFIGALAACGLIAGLAVRFRENRLFVFGAAWFLAFLLPALTLAGRYKIPLADRHAYLPAIGIAFAVAGLLGRAAGRRQAAVMGLLVAVFAGLSFAETRIWRNNGTLFERMVKDAPRIETGYTELARYYLQHGEMNRSLEVIERGERSGVLAADLARFIRMGIYCTEGERLLRKGDVASAEKLIARVLRLEPEFVPALIDAGSIAAHKGDLRGAVVLFNRAALLQPNDPSPRFNLAEVYRLLGNQVAAERELTEYRRLQSVGKSR